MVEIRNVFEKERVSKFLIRGIDAATINSLRRTIMSSVPSLAIEKVSVYENSSIMPDEMLAHRLGMLPITTERKSPKGEHLKLVLEKDGPCVVYSKDIKSTDPKLEVADKRVPLLKLKKGQKVKLEMEAVMGSGKEHAKWQACIVSYNQTAQIEIGKDCDLCKECIKSCPKEILELKGKNVVLKDETSCDLCGECADKCKQGAIKVSPVEGSFVLTLESTKAMDNSDAITKALELLLEKTEEFQKEVKKL